MFSANSEKEDNSNQMVEELLHSFKKLCCWMFHKVYYLRSHLEYFPDNMHIINDEKGEHFHQDVNVVEQHYQGSLDPEMMADLLIFAKGR
jgi:hypothetical protein